MKLICLSYILASSSHIAVCLHPLKTIITILSSFAMAEAFVFDVAKELGLSLTSYAKEQFLLAWELGSEVHNLENTMATINAYLKDVEEMPGGVTKHSDQDWLAKLRDAVYDADDLFDEIRTRVERKRLMEGNSFAKEVKMCFSSSKQFFTSISLAQRVKSIRESLDQIHSTRQRFRDATNLPVKMVENHRESHGSLLSANVVGRESEKHEIVSLLLDSTFENSVYVLPIVGVGGLGKSTLAWHVFQDERVKANFDLHLWVVLPQEITLKGMMEKIVASTGENPTEFQDLEQLKTHIIKHINGKKYILVLDNVWNENCVEWQDLESMLTVGAGHGSRIVLTTRSPIIAKYTNKERQYELRPLSDDNSWSLLESMVFGQRGCSDSHLKQIGLEILSMCNNVPLAIRALAGVLALDVSEKSWSLFRLDTLLNLASHGKDFDIMPILRASFEHLIPSSLKSCFSYCSLFPRGHRFDKLVNLWIAQGFVEKIHNRLGLEEQGAEYLDKLVNKGLVIHAHGEEYREGGCYKLHDLMYDLSCSVSVGHCKMLSSKEDHDVKRSIRHVSIGFDIDTFLKNQTSSLSEGCIRSFLRNGDCKEISGSSCHNLMARFLCLQVLDLHHQEIGKLPTSVGNLIHLRYLDLSSNPLQRLPNSITSLYNLQYLNLEFCCSLIELPKDMKKLVNLRHLLLNVSCYFPSGFGKLTNLQSLPIFVVEKERDLEINCLSGKKSKYCHLRNLKYLDCLSRELSILIQGSYHKMGSDAGEANLKGKKNLKYLRLSWNRPYDCKEDELLLENLQPPNQITKLSIYGFQGKKLPTWMATKQLTSCLPNMTSITIEGCDHIAHLPAFSQLCHLKYLTLSGLKDLEYLDSHTDECESTTIVFFPSLIEITIARLPKLRGWREGGDDKLSFPCVSVVRVSECKKLESMPSCPNMKKLNLCKVDNLGTLIRGGNGNGNGNGMSPKLESFKVDIVKHLVSLPRESKFKVSKLKLNKLKDLDFGELGKGLEGITSLKHLTLNDCHNSTSSCGLPSQFNIVESLSISECCANPFLFDGWQVLKNLCHLDLTCIKDLRVLPRGIQNLTMLQSLKLWSCENLEIIPDWIGDLCSLSILDIYGCKSIKSMPQGITKLTQLKLIKILDCAELGRRCQRDVGEDWVNIQHVKEISIRDLCPYLT